MEVNPQTQDDEVEKFKQRRVLAVCGAGKNRSKFISGILNDRGWDSDYRGVLPTDNYVMPEDLEFVGSIIFASEGEKKLFEKRKELTDAVERNKIKVYTLKTTQSHLDAANREHTVDALKGKIAQELDEIGFSQYKYTVNGKTS